jgi:hypothetical protein
MYPTNAVLRYEVPIDGDWSEVAYAGAIVHVGSRRDDVVEFWTLAHSGVIPDIHRLRVFGTGHRIPLSSYLHHGTAFTEGGSLVWHLIEDLSVFGGIN